MKVKEVRKVVLEVDIPGNMPDIDTDFPMLKRGLVKKYMEERFGHTQVCAVGTYTTMKVKAGFKDLCKLNNVSFQDANYITGMLDHEASTFEDFMKLAVSSERVRDFTKNHPEIVNCIPLIVGQPRAKSIHACAMMILPDNKEMFEWVPIREQDGDYVTEWEGNEMDSAGFLKEDILGVKELDKFEMILKLIKQLRGEDIDVYNIPVDDPRVFDYFQNGWNGDVFHFGSKGLTKYCKQLKPVDIEDLIAAISLYRPGAMENNFHNEYVKRRSGEKEVEYMVGMKSVLEKTYGVFCLEGNNKVSTSSGLKKIKDIIAGDLVLTEDGTLKRVLKKWNNGVKKVVEVRTTFGQSLFATEDHKVLTNTGWKEIKDLTKFDVIKSFWQCDEIKDRELTEFEKLEHWFIGYFIAEGCSGTGSPYITVGKLELANKVKGIMEILFPESHISIEENFNGENGYSFRVYVVSGNRYNGQYCKDFKPNQLGLLLKKYGLFGKKFHNKRLPEDCSIYTISGLIEGDGCLEGEWISLSNFDLIDDLYLKLQGYRIYSSVVYFDGKIENIHEYGTISYMDFYGKLKFMLHENKDVSINMGYRGWSIPAKEFVFEYKELDSEFRKIYFTKSKIDKKCLKLGVYEKNRHQLKGVVHSIWGKVLSIKEIGEREVFDLSVETNHSFVSGGLVVHNCYQEQIMQLCRTLGGLTMVEADDVRKAMVKKKYEELTKYKERFIPYYIDNFGVSQKYAEDVWDTIDKASTYLFNRSHAAAYTLTGYAGQWFKVHYPLEFWVTSFNFADDPEIPYFISEIQRTEGIKLQGIDINKSEIGYSFDVKSNSIFWGVKSIKGIGDVASSWLLEEREKNGEYFSFEEFLARVKITGSKVNKSHILSLILCGAFDIVENIPHPMDRISLVKSHCKFFKDTALEGDFVKFSSMDWLKTQKSLCGLALFDYNSMYSGVDGFFGKRFLDIPNLEDGDEGAVGGYVLDMAIRSSKKGEYADITLENNYDILNVKIWADTWRKLTNMKYDLKGELIILDGKVQYDSYKDDLILFTTDKTEFQVFK